LTGSIVKCDVKKKKKKKSYITLIKFLAHFNVFFLLFDNIINKIL